MEGYAPPVDQLAGVGEPSRGTGNWLDYRAMGIGPDDVPELIRMVADPRWDLMPSDTAGVWASLHAWRALGQLGAEAAVPALAELLADQAGEDWSDWVTEEVPVVLGMIGPAAIPEMASRLERDEKGVYKLIDFATALKEIALRHPEVRGGCIAILSRVLDRGGRNDPTLNGFLVCDLVDLRATEAADVIERAFAGEFVDDSVMGTWYDVWHDLELEGEPPPKTERLYHLALDPFIEPPPVFQGAARFGWQPVERRTPVERKDRNKARQKLEKKAKGKKGKRR